MLTGDTAKARAAYQDFFALWKDADPDVPILKEAKGGIREAAIAQKNLFLVACSLPMVYETRRCSQACAESSRGLEWRGQA